MKTLNALLLVAVAFSIELCVSADPSLEDCDSDSPSGEHCAAADRDQFPDHIESTEATILRSIPQFEHLIECDTEKSILDIAKYADYGCYCGLGGSGTPVDDLDRCCQVHDGCYEIVQKHASCKTFLQSDFWKGFVSYIKPFDYFALFKHFGKEEVPYLRSYDYTCDEDTKMAVCSESNDECKKILCECDRAAAECFAKSTMNQENRNLPEERCK